MGNAQCNKPNLEDESKTEKPDGLPENEEEAFEGTQPHEKKLLVVHSAAPEEQLTLSEVINELRESLSKANQDRENATKELASFQQMALAERADWENKVKTCENEKLLLTAELQDVRKQLEDLKTASESDKTKFETSLGDSQKVIRDHEKKILAFDLDLMRARDENQVLAKEVVDLRNKYAIESSEKNDLRKVIEEIRIREKQSSSLYYQKSAELEGKLNKEREELVFKSKEGVEKYEKYSELDRSYQQALTEKDTLLLQIEALKKQHAEEKRILLQDNEALLHLKDSEVNVWKKKYEETQQKPEVEQPVPEHELLQNVEETKSEEAEHEIRDEVEHQEVNQETPKEVIKSPRDATKVEKFLEAKLEQAAEILQEENKEIAQEEVKQEEHVVKQEEQEVKQEGLVKPEEKHDGDNN